jgi:hypothetical protein
MQVVAWPPDTALQQRCTPVASEPLHFQELRACSKELSSRFRLVNDVLVDLLDLPLRNACAEADSHTLLRPEIGGCYALQQAQGFRVLAPWPVHGAGKLLAVAQRSFHCDRFLVLRTDTALYGSAKLASPTSYRQGHEERAALPPLYGFQAMFHVPSRYSFSGDIVLLQMSGDQWAALRLGWDEVVLFSEPSRLLGVWHSPEFVGSNGRLCYVLCYLALVLDCGWPILRALFCGVPHRRRVRYALHKRDLWLVFQSRSFALAI